MTHCGGKKIFLETMKHRKQARGNKYEGKSPPTVVKTKQRALKSATDQNRSRTKADPCPSSLHVAESAFSFSQGSQILLLKKQNKTGHTVSPENPFHFHTLLNLFSQCRNFRRNSMKARQKVLYNLAFEVLFSKVLWLVPAKQSRVYMSSECLRYFSLAVREFLISLSL